MYIRSFRNSVIISAAVIIVACRGHNTMNGLARIGQSQIVLSLDDMIRTDSGSIKSDTVNSKLKYVHYIGADRCVDKKKN